MASSHWLFQSKNCQLSDGYSSSGNSDQFLASKTFPGPERLEHRTKENRGRLYLRILYDNELSASKLA